MGELVLLLPVMPAWTYTTKGIAGAHESHTTPYGSRIIVATIKRSLQRCCCIGRFGWRWIVTRQCVYMSCIAHMLCAVAGMFGLVLN